MGESTFASLCGSMSIFFIFSRPLFASYRLVFQGSFVLLVSLFFTPGHSSFLDECAEGLEEIHILISVWWSVEH